MILLARVLHAPCNGLRIIHIPFFAYTYIDWPVKISEEDEYEAMLIAHRSDDLESEAIRELKQAHSDALQDAIVARDALRREILLSPHYLEIVCPDTFSLFTPSARETLEACLVLQVHIANCRLVCKSWAEAGLKSLKLNLEVIRDFPSTVRHPNRFTRGMRMHPIRWDPALALDMHRRLRMPQGVVLIED
jgi:hypothetical protein